MDFTVNTDTLNVFDVVNNFLVKICVVLIKLSIFFVLAMVLINYGKEFLY